MLSNKERISGKQREIVLSLSNEGRGQIRVLRDQFDVDVDVDVEVEREHLHRVTH